MWKRAQQVYEGLPEEGRFHLSTLMIPTDREETLNVIRARLQTGRSAASFRPVWWRRA
ncbi:MAG: hypothetical protein ACLVB5_09750 [Christensenellales bacterium]